MSDTLANVRDRIRYLIDDRKPSAYTVSDDRLTAIINRRSAILGGKLLGSPASTPYVSVSLVQGTYDYRVGTATDEHSSIRQVIRIVDGLELTPRSLEYMNSRYLQETSQPASQGPPIDYAPWEDQTAGSGGNTTRIRVGPTPDATAGTLRVYREQVIYAVSADSDQIPFGTEAMRILETMVAIECVEGMPDDELAIRKLTPRIVNVWERDVKDGIRDENFRRRVMNGQTQMAIERRNA